jgi:serine/threonine protein kinase
MSAPRPRASEGGPSCDRVTETKATDQIFRRTQRQKKGPGYAVGEENSSNSTNTIPVTPSRQLIRLMPPMSTTASAMESAGSKRTSAASSQETPSSKRSSRSSSSPSEGNTDLGVRLLNNRLRSILMDPAALALFAAINRSSLDEKSLLQIAKYTKVPDLATVSVYSNLLKDAIAEAQRQKTDSVESTSFETFLTTEVTDQLNSLLKPPVCVVNEWKLSSNNEEKEGELDITFYDKADFDEEDKKRSDNTATVKVKCYGVIEVGIATKSKVLTRLFFEKLCQGLRYLDLMVSDDAKGPMSCTKAKVPIPKNAAPLVGEQGAMLLSIVVLSHDLNDGCFADFFCKRRMSSEGAKWRISLLSKVKTSTREESSTAFATTVAAIVSLKDFVPGDNSTWDYLGPNCSKVSHKAAGAEGQQKQPSFVLRAYDTRMRPTARSPNLYLRESPPSGVEGTVAMFHFKEKESNEEANFGIDTEPDRNHDVIGTFFERTGHLLVLCIPYLEGQHAVTMGAQGLRLATALQKLHSDGLMHGDIRGYNTINGPDDSYLIDFDFGGEEKKGVKYPPGYNFRVPDGTRCETSIEGIVQADDVFALGQWLLYSIAPVGVLDNVNLALDYLRVQAAIDSIPRGILDERTEAERETEAKAILQKMIDFFKKYEDEPFMVKRGLELTEPDATSIAE